MTDIRACAHVGVTRKPSTTLHPSTPQLLEDLAGRLGRLAPSHRDPEHFHLERSELVHELRRLARRLGRP